MVWWPRKRMLLEFTLNEASANWLDRKGGYYLARLRYSPVRVSTATISPMLTNGGTVILRPVSSVAGLNWAAAVAPLTDGSVSLTWSSTVAGRSREIGLPSYNTTWALLPSFM